VQKEPYPLKVMTRFTDAPLDTGRRRPVICKELTERTEFVDKVVQHEVNDCISPIEPVALAGHLGKSMQCLLYQVLVIRTCVPSRASRWT